MVVTDLDGNDRLDLVLAHPTWIYIHILLGNGNGTFGAPVNISTGPSSGPASAAIRDFNRDGYSDIVVANYGTKNIGILLGKGNGTFKTQTKLLTGSDNSPFVIVADDFNRDGHFDLAAITGGQLPLLYLVTVNSIVTHQLSK